MFILKALYSFIPQEFHPAAESTAERAAPKICTTDSSDPAPLDCNPPPAPTLENKQNSGIARQDILGEAMQRKGTDTSSRDVGSH